MDEIIESIVNGTNPRTILDHINKFKVEYLDKKTKPILRSQVTQLWNLLIASDTQDELANLTSAYGRELCYLIMKDMLQNDCNIIEEENTLCLMQMASRCERSFLIINSRQWVIYAADIEGVRFSMS